MYIKRAHVPQTTHFCLFCHSEPLFPWLLGWRFFTVLFQDDLTCLSSSSCLLTHDGEETDPISISRIPNSLFFGNRWPPFGLEELSDEGFRNWWDLFPMRKLTDSYVWNFQGSSSWKPRNGRWQLRLNSAYAWGYTRSEKWHMHGCSTNHLLSQPGLISQ